MDHRDLKPAKADRVEHVGFLLCALMLGLLIGWCAGTYAAIINLGECIDVGE